MRDYGAAIRKSFYDALSGTVSYQATVIPVFDEKVEGPVEKDIWIVLADQVDQDRSNKSLFAYETTIDININAKRKSVGGKKVIEDISDSILQIILPTRVTTGLTIASPFKITYCQYISGNANALTQDATNQFVHIKTLQFKIRITQ